MSDGTKKEVTTGNVIAVLAPFVLFIGQYFTIGVISIANLFCLLLAVLATLNFLKSCTKQLGGYAAYFIAFLLYGLLSVTWTMSGDSMSILLSVFTGVMTMLYIATLPKEDLALFLKSLMAFTLLVIVWGCFEIFTGNYFLFNNATFIVNLNQYGMHYPGVAFPNPNDLGQFLAFALPVTIFIWFEQGKAKLLCALAALLGVFVLFHTTSRMAVICVVISIFVYFLLSLVAHNKGYGKSIALFMVIAVLAFVIMAFFVDFSVFDLRKDFLEVDTSGDYFVLRNDLYAAVFQLGLEHLFAGAGIGSSYIPGGTPPHNMFLFIFADFGVFFAIAFAVCLIAMAIRLCKKIKQKEFGCFFHKIVLAAFVSFPILSSISSGNEQRKAVWMLLGIVLAAVQLGKKQQEEPSEQLVHSSLGGEKVI